MRFLFLGDVVGDSGIEAVKSTLPKLRSDLDIDFAVVNVENAADGFGVTQAICDDITAAGADAMTTGNHAFDKRDFDLFDREERLIRPVNYPPGTAGRGAGLFQDRKGRKVLVANVMCKAFMDPNLDDPFRAMDDQLGDGPLGEDADFVLIDMHGEATAEKMALGWYLDGRASLVVGTHTHVPTADTRILPEGTAYQSDSGMCGTYNSILGMKKEGSLNRFLTKMPGHKLEAESGPWTVCGVFVETDDASRRAVRAEPVRVGEYLLEHVPSV